MDVGRPEPRPGEEIASIASGKPFRPSQTSLRSLRKLDCHGDQDVLDAAGLQLVHHLEPEFGALGRLDPEPENVLRSICCDAKRAKRETG